MAELVGHCCACGYWQMPNGQSNWPSLLLLCAGALKQRFAGLWAGAWSPPLLAVGW